jgi:hypothetical protein
MADLDKIVRPFQLLPRASALAEKVLEVRKPGTPVTIRAGVSGKGKTINGTLHVQFRCYHDDEVKEVGSF